MIVDWQMQQEPRRWLSFTWRAQDWERPSAASEQISMAMLPTKGWR